MKAQMLIMPKHITPEQGREIAHALESTSGCSADWVIDASTGGVDATHNPSLSIVASTNRCTKSEARFFAIGFMVARGWWR